jgi:DNA-binding NtrC family response regulator
LASPLRILLVDDEEIVHQAIGDYLREIGHAVDDAYDGTSGVAALGQQVYDLALLDLRMPGLDGLALLDHSRDQHPATDVVIITGHGDMDAAVQALRLGAVDFLVKPVKLRELDAVLEKALRLRTLRQDRQRVGASIGTMPSTEERRTPDRRFVGASRATRRVRQEIAQALAAETILITGATGTGKEVVAREIHFHSGSEERPFVAVSCPALPESLVESELFGHVKGAFTGATDAREGYFALADGGTLFLDEVADLAPPVQAKLLRALETREVWPLGGRREQHVDVRVVAATNFCLEELVAKGRFRADLYYRLHVFTIHLEPLCARRADIMPLAEHFLAAYAEPRALPAKGFTTEAASTLRAYSYPGNARELRNIIERAAILCRDEMVQREHLHLSSSDTPGQVSLPADNSEVDRILAALEATRWNRRQAARDLGMAYSTLRYKIQRHGLR